MDKQNKPTTKDETPIFFSVLAAKQTTESDFKANTQGLTLQDWKKAVEDQK